MARDVNEISAFIVEWLSEQLGQPVNPDAELAGLGIDSLDAVRLTDALAVRLGVEELSVELMLEHPSIPALSRHLATLP
jgi:acyl carrier protein